jgi:thioesterase domain-containing protein
VIPPLQAEGYQVIASQHGLDSLEGDVATVTRAIGRVSGPVLLVGHSYGGTLNGYCSPVVLVGGLTICMTCASA